jgi:hypothetical protein
MIRLAHPKMPLPAKWLQAWLPARVFCVLLFALVSPPPSRAWQAKANWNDAAAELIGKVMDRAGRPSGISLDLRNASALSSAEAYDVRRAINSQLSARSIRVVKPEQAVADVRVTLSENASGLLWIAEIRSGTRRDVVMTEVARSEPAAAAQVSPALTLLKEQVWSQYEPILDFALFGDHRSRLLVLEPRTVSLYRLNNSRWNLEQSQPVPRSTPLPADVRGRLLLLRDQKFEAFIPGQHCTGSADGSLTLECRQADDPWPLAGENSPRSFFSATRNFFTGVFTGSNATKSSAPFFSAANVQNGGRDTWVFAGTDGRFRQTDLAESELRVSWGGALAGIKSGCGSGWQILASGTGDWTQRDLLQGFELGQGATPVTSAVEVPGPVTALWAAADGASAAVVSRNLGTGKYEAFSFSIGCR